jgi:hypothetical protein
MHLIGAARPNHNPPKQNLRFSPIAMLLAIRKAYGDRESISR